MVEPWWNHGWPWLTMVLPTMVESMVLTMVKDLVNHCQPWFNHDWPWLTMLPWLMFRLGKFLAVNWILHYWQRYCGCAVFTFSAIAKRKLYNCFSHKLYCTQSRALPRRVFSADQFLADQCITPLSYLRKKVASLYTGTASELSVLL